MHWHRPKSHIAKAATKNNSNLRFKIKITCIRATNRRRIRNTKHCYTSVKTSCHHGPCRQTDKSEVWTLEARQLLENVPQSSQRFSKYPAGVKPFESGRKKGRMLGETCTLGNVEEAGKVPSIFTTSLRLFRRKRAAHARHLRRRTRSIKCCRIFGCELKNSHVYLSSRFRVEQ